MRWTLASSGLVLGETVVVPYRIYHPEPDADEERALTATQRTVLHCLYSRHHDGFVRQRHLEQIVDGTDAWAVPFVVRLVGEHVLEIVTSIRHGLADLDVPGSSRRAMYGDVVARNPLFFTLTEYRAVSYWSEYHRWRHPDLGSYPGRRVLDTLRAAGGERAGRRLPRHTPA